MPYEEVPFHTLSNDISPIDLYYPHSSFFTLCTYPLGALEWLVPRFLPGVRRMALAKLHDLVRMEDENTNCQTIGPVSKAFNMLVRWVEDGKESVAGVPQKLEPVLIGPVSSEAFKQHRATVEDFLWMGREGLMMTGTK